MRADTLGGLSARGWAALVRHGVLTVVDLRNDDELGVDAAPRPAGLATVHVPLDGVEDREFWATWHSGPQFGTPLYYAAHLERIPERSVAALRAVALAGRGGVAVHCVGCRYRTGQSRCCSSRSPVWRRRRSRRTTRSAPTGWGPAPRRWARRTPARRSARSSPTGARRPRRPSSHPGRARRGGAPARRQAHGRGRRGAAPAARRGEVRALGQRPEAVGDEPGGASSTARRWPGLIPSLRGSGVAPYPPPHSLTPAARPARPRGRTPGGPARRAPRRRCA